MDLKKILAGTSVAIFLTIAFTSDSRCALDLPPFNTFRIALLPPHVFTNSSCGEL